LVNTKILINKYMKRILAGIALAAMLPLTSLAAALPFFPTFNNLGVMCCLGTRSIYKASGPQSLMRFKVGNPSPSPIDVTSLTIRYTGNLDSGDLGQISWWDDVDGVFLGDSTIDFTNKLSTLSGVITSIPANGFLEITAYVHVKAGATSGHSGTFEIDSGDIITSIGAAVGSYPAFSTYLVVNDPPVIPTPATITVLFPNGGETLTRGNKYSLMWSTKNAPLGSYVRKVELWQGGVFIRYIDVQSVPVSFIGSKLCASQSVRWVVPADLPPANNYRIRVRLFKGTTDSPNQIDTDQSDANFRIN
jgi:hypothetical protein